ncbi:MAG: hypothetical protein EBT07_03250 [Actinobacteria bacterium]|nr:hypothetical protein [Actinomycetota bacterium]
MKFRNQDNRLVEFCNIGNSISAFTKCVCDRHEVFTMILRIKILEIHANLDLLLVIGRPDSRDNSLRFHFTLILTIETKFNFL